LGSLFQEKWMREKRPWLGNMETTKNLLNSVTRGESQQEQRRREKFKHKKFLYIAVKKSNEENSAKEGGETW